MELSSKEKGNLTELQCITAFYKLGYQVSIPYGENSRYDFIADVNGKLIRVQVKTSSIKKDTQGAISFATASTRINSTQNITHRYTKNEIDYFATYCVERDTICLFNIKEMPNSTIRLRYEPAKNGQTNGVRWEKDYLIETVLGE